MSKIRRSDVRRLRDLADEAGDTRLAVACDWAIIWDAYQGASAETLRAEGLISYEDHDGQGADAASRAWWVGGAMAWEACERVIEEGGA